MKNFDKYGKQIKKLGYNFAINKNKNNEMNYCTLTSCKDCIFNEDGLSGDSSFCFKNRIKWLYDDEQLLTDDEKEYLKTVIKPFRDDIINFSFTDNELFIYFVLNNKNFIIPNIFKNKDLIGNGYSLEELGL